MNIEKQIEFDKIKEMEGAGSNGMGKKADNGDVRLSVRAGVEKTVERYGG